MSRRCRNVSDTCDKLRIGSLIFGSLKSMGGYQIFTYNLLTRLAQRGHQVDLYIPQEEYSQDREVYCSMMFDVRPLFFKTYSLFRFVPVLLKAYLRYKNQKNKYQVWQIVGAHPAGNLACALSSRVPIVLRTHGDDVQKDQDLNYGQRLNSSLEAKIRRTVHGMDRLVALTESVSVCYRELGVGDGKIVEIPNGVDVARFSKNSNRDTVRSEWGLPLDRPLILTVGRYHEKKDFATIPRIARKLKKEGVIFHWLIVGRDTDKLNRLIDTEAVTDCVHTAGEIGPSDSPSRTSSFEVPSTRLISLYRCADLFVFPSRMETFGRVIIEAMAAGLPVVTTDAPGCRDVVRHGHTGLLVQPGSIDEFVKQIRRLLRDSVLRQYLVGNGFQHAKLHDWEQVVDQYEDLYRSLIPT